VLIIIVLFYLHVFLHGIGSFIGYFCVVFKYVCNYSDFFSELYKCGQFDLFLMFIMLECCVTFVFKTFFGTGSVVKCVLLCCFLCFFHSLYRVCVKSINPVVNC
jgi:hypothetical protein